MRNGLNEIQDQAHTHTTPIVGSILAQNQNVMFAGGSNINLLQIQPNKMYCEFFLILMSHGLNPHITLTTHFSEKNGTIIYLTAFN